MHYGLLISNDYISISEILSELKFYLDNTIMLYKAVTYHYFYSVA